MFCFIIIDSHYIFYNEPQNEVGDIDGDALLRHVMVYISDVLFFLVLGTVKNKTPTYYLSQGELMAQIYPLLLYWKLTDYLLDCFHEWKVYRKRHFSQIFSSSVHLTQERNFGEKFCPNAAGLRTTLPHSTWNIGRLITQTRSFFFREFLVRLIIDSKG